MTSDRVVVCQVDVVVGAAGEVAVPINVEAQDIGPGAAVQHQVGRVEDQDVVAVAADHLVDAGAAVQEVSTIAAGQHVVAAAAPQVVEVAARVSERVVVGVAAGARAVGGIGHVLDHDAFVASGSRVVRRDEGGEGEVNVRLRRGIRVRAQGADVVVVLLVNHGAFEVGVGHQGLRVAVGVLKRDV